MICENTLIDLQRDQWRLIRQVARSNYGEVWLAENPSGLRGAVKFAAQDRIAGLSEAARAPWRDALNKEIRFLHTLSPWDERYIVRLLDDGIVAGMPVAVLEWMAGDLGARMAAPTAPSLRKIIQWLGELNQALGKLHRFGMRHLDVKPANVLLTHDGEHVKLADFGTIRRTLPAALRPRAEPQRLLHGVRGTPGWFAPEQFFAAAPASDEARYRTDARADYFALGALFYCLVTSGMPLRFCKLCAGSFRSSSAAALDAHRPPTLFPDEARLFLELIRDDTEGNHRAGEAALQLLQSLLAADPQRRPSHGLAIARALDRLLCTLDAGYNHARDRLAAHAP